MTGDLISAAVCGALSGRIDIWRNHARADEAAWRGCRIRGGRACRRAARGGRSPRVLGVSPDPARDRNAEARECTSLNAASAPVPLGPGCSYQLGPLPFPKVELNVQDLQPCPMASGVPESDDRLSAVFRRSWRARRTAKTRQELTSTGVPTGI